MIYKAQRLLAQQAFSPQNQATWEKAHGGLDRRRVARGAVSPEQLGPCGCWQVTAVQRESLDLTEPDAKRTVEIGCYATSLSLQEQDDASILEFIGGHWAAIESGTPYRRDVTLGEEACRTAKRQGAEVLATRRNLGNGRQELEHARGRTKVDAQGVKVRDIAGLDHS
jgi:hypothetical protein